MESNSDIFIESESLSIRIPKYNISDSELEISDSSISSLLSEGMEYISDVSPICDRNSTAIRLRLDCYSTENSPRIPNDLADYSTVFFAQFLSQIRIDFAANLFWGERRISTTDFPQNLLEFFLENSFLFYNI